MIAASTSEDALERYVWLHLTAKMLMIYTHFISSYFFLYLSTSHIILRRAFLSNASRP